MSFHLLQPERLLQRGPPPAGGPPGGPGGHAGPSAMQTAHIQWMPYLWAFVIDFGIFFAIYKYRRYSIYVHAAIGLLVSLTTLITSLQILVDEGIPAEQNPKFKQRHYIMGLVICIFLMVQILAGIISIILQCIPWSSSFLIYCLNVFHKYTGYAFIIVGKIQNYQMMDVIMELQQKDIALFWGLLAIDIVLFIFWLIRKLWFPTLEQIVIPSRLLDEPCHFKALKTVAQASDVGQSVGIFANYVYNLQPIRRFHPIGYQIIRAIQGRDLDRYLYGSFISERVFLIPANSHTFKTLDLLGDPVGFLNIESTYNGLQKQINEVKIESIVEVSERGNIYQLHITGESALIYFKGYSQIEQIGRFFALTINQKVTRLYTTVGFLDPKNINFLQTKYFEPNNILTNANYNRVVKFNASNKQICLSQRKLGQNNSYIPLLIKKYQNGKMTRQLINENPTKVQLSSQRGEGLQLGTLSAGRIIIVAGGTGLYPFSDLIDLLFKATLIKLNPSLKSQIITLSPLLNENIFDKWPFTLYLAVNHIEDIHPVTWAQINVLSEHKKQFQVKLRVKENASDRLLKNSTIQMTSQHFETLVARQISGQNFVKIWVCGPIAMNSAMLKLFDEKQLDESKYLMV